MEKVISIKDAMELCDDDEEFMEEMVCLVRDDLKLCINLLAKAFMDNNPKETREVSHRIKGQAANLAANDLWDKSKKVEDAAKLGFCTKMEYLHLIISIKTFVRHTRYLS